MRLRTTLCYSGALLFSIAIFSSCRTTQQARRSQQVNHPANTTAQRMDSLLLIEDRLVNVIDSLTSRVDQDRGRIRTLEQQVSMLRSQIDGAGRPPALQQGRLPVPMPGAGGEAYHPTTSSPPPTITGPSESTRGLDVNYTDALHEFNVGRYESALSSFRTLIRENPSGAYAPNYHYWLGESLFALHRYNEALQAFSEVLNTYPSSLKADDAQFKIGECYERMKLPTSAADAYRSLLDHFPESEYAARVRARIRSLR